MAEIGNRRRQSTRLQRRAPASIEVNRSPDWKVAIPLLSPLAVTSPPRNLIGSRPEQSKTASSRAEQSKTTSSAVFNNWQHPAAPFYYDPNPLVSVILVDGS